jgi:VWFA-related protein
MEIKPRIILLMLAGLAALPLLTGQPNSPRFSTDVELAEIDVLVKSLNDSRPIEGLGCADFELEQDGVPQSLASCQLGSVPIDLVVLADLSGSVVENVRKMSQAVGVVVKKTLKPEDRLAAITFSSSIDTIQSLTQDHHTAIRRLENALSRVSRVDSGTKLYEAVLAATKIFERPRIKGRARAALVLSDDKDGKSKPSQDEVTLATLEADLTVFGILLPSFEPPRASAGTNVNLPLPRIPRTLDYVLLGPRKYRSISQIIEASGGEAVMSTNDPDAIVSAMNQISHRYRLAYYPKPALVGGKPARIKVRLTREALAENPNSAVRHRPEIVKQR